jgi:RNA recognition motif-containing protein
MDDTTARQAPSPPLASSTPQSLPVIGATAATAITTTTTVYVGNLAPQVGEDHLHKMLELCGYNASHIRRIHICKHRDGVSKGFSFIELDSSNLVQQVIQQWNGQAFCGRKLVVRPAREPPNKSGSATITRTTASAMGNSAPSSTSVQLEREKHSLESKIAALKRVISDRNQEKQYPNKRTK